MLLSEVWNWQDHKHIDGSTAKTAERDAILKPSEWWIFDEKTKKRVRGPFKSKDDAGRFAKNRASDMPKTFAIRQQQDIK